MIDKIVRRELDDIDTEFVGLIDRHLGLINTSFVC